MATFQKKYKEARFLLDFCWKLFRMRLPVALWLQIRLPKKLFLAKHLGSHIKYVHKIFQKAKDINIFQKANIFDNLVCVRIRVRNWNFSESFFHVLNPFCHWFLHTPWKYQKNLWFSAIFRGYRKRQWHETG